MDIHKFCCISASLAVKIIGTYMMSTSILLINVLMSYFFTRNEDEEFFESVKAWAMLGLNWIQAVKYTELHKKAQIAIILFLIYTVSFLLASAYLVLGSTMRRHKYAVPWMYLQMISIIDQTVALSDHIIYNRWGVEPGLMGSAWYIFICSVYLTINLFFWVIVQITRNQWYEEQQNRMECEPRISDPPLAITSGLKSPSYLSQNFSMFESPRPPILPK